MKYSKTLLASCLAMAMGQAQAAISIEWNGLIEMSAQHDGTDTTLVVDTVELGVAATLSEDVSAEVVILKEGINSDDETDLDVDTAVVNIALGTGTFTGGLMTVPFTTGETNMISDSTTLVEPAGGASAYAMEMGNMGMTVYVADPDGSSYTAGDMYGFNMAYTINDVAAFNASLISYDSDTAMSAMISGGMGNFGYIIEATDLTNANALATDMGLDNTKTSTNIEVSYDAGYGTFAYARQKDGAGTNYNLVSFGKEVASNTFLTAEYNKSDESGSDANITVMLATEF